MLPHNVIKTAFVVNDVEKHLAIYADLFGIDKLGFDVELLEFDA